MSQLTLKNLVEYFSISNNHSCIRNKNKFLVSSYPKINIDYPANFTQLLTIFLLADLNVNYDLNPKNNRIKINDELLNEEKNNLIKYISNNISIEIARKKRLIYQINNNQFSNDIVLILTDYFNTTIIIYQVDYDIVKIYYSSDKLDQNKPLIIVNYRKDINSLNYGYEIIKNNDELVFDFLHPVVQELIKNCICIGLEPDKKFQIGDNIDYTYINELKQSVTNQQKINLIGLTNKNKKFIDKILKQYPRNIDYVKSLLNNYYNTNTNTKK